MVLGVGLVFAVTAQARQAGPARATCGVERWTVKTLQDRPRLLPVKKVTVAYLVTRSAPPSLATTRLPFERHVFQVRAAVTLVRPKPTATRTSCFKTGRTT
jgi:hypothetical protein